MQDLCACIYAQAIPTQDVMFMLAMLTRLKCKADNIRSEMTSYYISNKAVDSTALSQCIEQEIIYKIKSKNSSDTTLAAQTGHCQNQNSGCSVRIPSVHIRMAILAVTVGRQAALWKEKGTRYSPDTPRLQGMRSTGGKGLRVPNLLGNRLFCTASSHFMFRHTL